MEQEINYATLENLERFLKNSKDVFLKKNVYSTGTSSTSGLTKLYTETGNNTDGTMTQSAIKTELENKVDKVSGKDLSTNDYTTAEKNKLKGIAAGATANTGTITGVKMNGSSKGTSGVVDLGTVLTGGKQTSTSNADSGSNVYTFSDGSTITVKNGSKGSTGSQGPQGEKGATGPQGEKGDPGVNATTTSVATTSSNGLMSPAMVSKLDSIADNANNFTYTHPSYTSRTKGLYKVAVDGSGHVNDATAVTKDDIIGLGITYDDVGAANSTHTHTTSDINWKGVTMTTRDLPQQSSILLSLNVGSSTIASTGLVRASSTTIGVMTPVMYNKLEGLRAFMVSTDEPSSQQDGDIWLKHRVITNTIS